MTYQDPSLKQAAEKAPRAEQPERRLLTVMRVAKLVAGSFEELCVVRAIGPGGVLLECHIPLQAQQRVWIELNDDTPYWGTVLWQKDGIAGVGFDDLYEPRELLARAPGALDRRTATAPRLRVEARGRVQIGAVEHEIWIHSLSPGGAGITFHPEYDDDPEPGEGVVFTTGRMDPVQATLRWYHAGRAGLEFAVHLSLDEFTHWLTDSFGSAVMKRHFHSMPDDEEGETNPFGAAEIVRILGMKR